MNGRNGYPGQQTGFTLVELLVVILIFGIFAGAVYSLYIAHMKTVLTREEVLDVQQNVRIAMDRLTRDVRMAGFLATPALEKAMSNYTSIAIRTASSDGIFVSINDVLQSDRFSAVPAAALGNFTPGSDTVTIVRPSTKNQLGGVFSVLSSSSTSGQMSISPAAPSDTLRVGDMVCRATSYPDRILYHIDRASAAQGCDKSPCLTRSKCADAACTTYVSEVVAQGITTLRFDYFLDGVNDDPQTGVAALTDDELRKLTAVRVTVIGQTSKRTGPDQTFKTRELRSLIKLRNYR